jgi:hypothetical protein
MDHIATGDLVRIRAASRILAVTTRHALPWSPHIPQFLGNKIKILRYIAIYPQLYGLVGKSACTEGAEAFFVSTH